MILRHFRIFRTHPNYAFYFACQVFSMTGSWIQSTVQGWLVYDLSNSGAWLGIISFCTQVPAFLVSPFAGVTADRVNRRRALKTIQLLAMFQAGTMATLYFTGHLVLWQIAALSIFLGLINGFEMTTRQAFSVDMVGKQDLPSAIALNSLIFNGSRIIGPAIAGALVGFIGPGWCFVWNAASFLAMILCLTWIPSEQKKLDGPGLRGNPLKHIAAGFAYVKRSQEILALLVIGALVSLLSSPFIVLMPMVAKDVLKGDASTLGWLSASHGVGALIGGLSSGVGATHGKTLRAIHIRILLLGISLWLLGLSHVLWASMGLLFIVGYFLLGIYPTVNSAIQQRVDDSMRGRVLSLYTMMFLGTMPLGGLLAGWIADRTGALFVIAVSGGLCVVVGMILLIDFGAMRKYKALLTTKN